VVRGEAVLHAADWPRRKAAALLQRLALQRQLLKEEAIDFLWPEADPASGANNLYRTLHALRQTVDRALGAGTAEATLSFADGVLALTDSVWVDALEFEALAQSGQEPAGGPFAWQQALDLYAGDLLPSDLYAEWTLGPREHLRQLCRQASLGLAAHYRQARDAPRAISTLMPWLARDKADEVIHRELMRAYALSGRRHDALRQYQACVAALAAELDVPPEPETTALYARILSGELSPLALPADAGSHPAGATLFVGREPEMETLQLWLRGAWRGQGRAILIAGDSGVGKTRLAAEAMRVAAAAGLTTLFGAAYEQEGQLPYQPFVEAFDAFLATSPALPEGLEPLNPVTHFKRLGVSDPQQESLAQFKAVAGFLGALGQAAPVVLVADDLHAADEASLRLFHYLARQTRTNPLVLLATYRPEFSQAAGPIGRLLNALYRERLSDTLALAPLGAGAIAQVLSDELAGSPAPELVAAVHELTEGNPFYAQEMTRALLKDGRVEVRDGLWQLSAAGQALRLPAGLSGLVHGRVRRLGPDVEAALIAGAVIGREFSFDVLRGVVALPEADALAALDAALAGRVLDETEHGYRFRHALIRRALYDSLSRVRRARLHAQTAEAIEAVEARRAHGSQSVEELAFHYDLSDRRERALPYLIQAGQNAAGIYAFEVAVHHFEQALALMDALDLGEAGRRWLVLESLGWWHTILANTPRAVQRFDQAAGLQPDPSWQPARRDRARVLRGAFMALITAGDIDAAETHLRAALAEVAEHEDAAEYAHVLYNAAQLYWHRGEHQAAFDAAQQSLGVAERLNDPAGIARAFEMLALACHSLGEWQDGLRFEAQRATLAGAGLDVTEAFDVHL
jgi:DNA-binding SARP family transcriptional activator